MEKFSHGGAGYNYIIMESKSYKNILIIGLIIGLILSVNQCSTEKRLTKSQGEVFTASVQYYQNKLGTITATKKVLQLSNKDLKKLIYFKDSELNELRKEFAKVKTIVKTKTIVIIDSVPVPFDVRVPCDFERKGKHLDKWLQFDYAVNQDGFNISKFTIPNDQTIITGFKRKWFLGKQTYVTDITNSNPYIKTIEVQTIQVVVPKRFYDTRLFNIGVGFIGGVLISR